MSNDNEVSLKQYPYSLKAEPAASGAYKITGHVYTDTKETAVKELASMIDMAITEFEARKLPLLINEKKGVKI